MPATDTKAPPADERAASRARAWNWHPELPIENDPLFAWPPDPVRIAKAFAANWLALTARVFILATSLVSWFYLQPALERCVEFEFGWMAQMYARNLGLMLLVAGGLHLYFYTFSRQGIRLKFDTREMARKNGAFNFRNQVLDNMFWSLASGVTVWTAYEILMMWGFANGYIAVLQWTENPVWFVAVFLLVPIWYSFHFYWGHRLLHWPPLYRMAHALHHRNINIGPWSGISMHPVEHVIYFSSVLIHWVVASHPVHILFHMQFDVLAAVTSHSGFEGLEVKDKNRVALGYFFHQLHHRYFECNYGTGEMPWDKWFGSFHDGTPEATAHVRERRRRMYGSS